VGQNRAGEEFRRHPRKPIFALKVFVFAIFLHSETFGLCFRGSADNLRGLQGWQNRGRNKRRPGNQESRTDAGKVTSGRTRDGFAWAILD
jgi:hypothetical protein